jgi:hypothetical protein
VRQLTYGVTVDTDVDLGVSLTDHAAELTIRRSGRAVVAGAVEWVDRTSDPWMRAGQVGGCLYLGFGEEAEFVIAADGRSVRWHRSVECSPDTLVHLLLDHVLPRVLTRLDRVVLHGSCVDSGDGGCVALLGRSGSGKSTLAAALMARGCRVVADDCVVVRWCDERPQVTSAYPGLRLTDRSVALAGVHGLRGVGSVSRYSAKFRMVPPDGGHSVPGAQHPLQAVLVIGHPDDGPVAGPLLEPLGPAVAGIELLRHSFHLNAADERADLLHRVLPLAEEVPTYRMRYVHTASGLDLALETVRSVLRPRPECVATA